MLQKCSIIYFLIVFLLLGCGPRISNPSKVVHKKAIECPNGSVRIPLNCTSDLGLKERVIGANASLTQLGIGIGGNYEERAVGQISDATYTLALKLETLCKEYNSCLVSPSEYKQQAQQIRSVLNSHLSLVGRMSNGYKIGDSVWSNAVPSLFLRKKVLGFADSSTLSGGKINLDFGFFYENQNGKLSVLNQSAHLNSGDGFGIFVRPQQNCYLYAYQVDATGTSFRLFPNPDFGTMKNPLQAKQGVWLPNQNDLYVLDQNTGMEKIYFVVSPDPVKKLESMTGLPLNQWANVIKTMGVAGTKKRVSAPPASSVGKFQGSDSGLIDLIKGQGSFMFEFSFWHD